MFARLGAKALFLAMAIALVFFGVGLLGVAVATWLAARFGTAGGYAIAGGAMLLAALICALAIRASRPLRKENTVNRELMNSIFAGLARETPWAALLGAGLVGVANLFLNRNKTKK